MNEQKGGAREVSCFGRQQKLFKNKEMIVNV